MRHWVDDLGIDGVFVAGKQGEFFSMSLAERKRSFEIAVEETAGRRRRMSCSDQNLDMVIELARHAAGDRRADYIVVHAPVLHFLHKQDETLYQYYGPSRAGRHRHRAVEPSRQRLSDEPRAVRADRRTAERGRDQVQRAARDVCAADAARRRQDAGQHRLRGGVVRQHRRARLAALSVLVAALPVPDQGRPADARIHRPRVAGEVAKARRCATASIRCARRSAARGRPRSRMRIRNTGRNCSARSAARCARRCWN